MDQIETMQQVADQLKRVAAGVDVKQLDAPTPCENWTVRDLMNHLAGGAAMLGTGLRDGSIPDEEASAMMGDMLGGDPVGAINRQADFFVGVLNGPNKIDETVTLPFGVMPGTVALDIAIVDVTVHTWDLARATGQDTDFDVAGPASVAEKVITPDWRAPGIFGPEQQVPSGACQADQLAAYAGRTV
jgi:uncharacterized protein (TIGR03086 family)